nr:B12-binding domain-containing radical SAM protein [Lachnospiraceae bacterium]
HFVNDCMHEQLNSKSIKYNYHQADESILEGVFARGDRRLSKVLLLAYKKGCLFDAWTETFKVEPWKEAFKECNISTYFYSSRERSLDEKLPWDMIDIGVSKEFLKREWNNARNETVTPNCRSSCSGCGAAVFGGGVCYESKD